MKRRTPGILVLIRIFFVIFHYLPILSACLAVEFAAHTKDMGDLGTQKTSPNSEEIFQKAEWKKHLYV